MYGRANFDLLRLRVIHAAQHPSHRHPPKIPNSFTKRAEEPFLRRHVTPLPRRNVVYFSSGAYTTTIRSYTLWQKLLLFSERGKSA
jgi:hypothetical protein